MSRDKRSRVEAIRSWIIPALFGAGIPLLASTTHWMWLWYLSIATSVVLLIYAISVMLKRAGA